MAKESAAQSGHLVVRPHRHLFPRGILAVFALTTPVFAVVYWLTLASGGWALVLAIHALVLIASLVAVIAYFGTTIHMAESTIRERGFFGRITEVPLTSIAKILMVDMYQGSTLDTQPQLFLCDGDGRLLIRMRGQFWSRTDMERVIDWLDLPVTTSPQTLTLADVRQVSPHLLYWFERWPQLRSRQERPARNP